MKCKHKWIERIHERIAAVDIMTCEKQETQQQSNNQTRVSRMCHPVNIRNAQQQKRKKNKNKPTVNYCEHKTNNNKQTKKKIIPSASVCEDKNACKKRIGLLLRQLNTLNFGSRVFVFNSVLFEQTLRRAYMSKSIVHSIISKSMEKKMK